MTEVSKVRTHAKQVAASRGNKSPDQIAVDKNHRAHARQEAARKRRRKDAEGRQAAWDKLTAQQKIAALDERLGKGLGAKRQRDRLASK